MKQNVLFINHTMNVGGIESFLISLLKYLDHDKYNITFLCYKDESFDFESIINELGSKVIKLNTHNKTTKKIINDLKVILKNEKIDIVHDNTYFYSLISIIAAKKCGIKKRIVHAHTSLALKESKYLKRVRNVFLRKLINYYATDKIAVSKEAGKALFGNKKYTFIENGIDVNKFKYDENTNKQLRKKLKIDSDSLVIGHVGRYVAVKNHEFIIEVFEKYLKKDPNAILLLLGEGELRQQIENITKKLNIYNNIRFINYCDSHEKYYNIMDIYIMPSLYEGFPITFVEAQINGIPVFLSDKITKDCNITNYVEFLPINNSEIWVEKILTKKHFRFDSTKYFEKSNFNIKNTVKKIEDIYRK